MKDPRRRRHRHLCQSWSCSGHYQPNHCTGCAVLAKEKKRRKGSLSLSRALASHAKGKPISLCLSDSERPTAAMRTRSHILQNGCVYLYVCAGALAHANIAGQRRTKNVHFYWLAMESLACARTQERERERGSKKKHLIVPPLPEGTLKTTMVFGRPGKNASLDFCEGRQPGRPAGHKKITLSTSCPRLQTVQFRPATTCLPDTATSALLLA